MSAKGNCTKEADGTIVYKTVSKTGAAPVELDSSKWYMDKCEIAGYRSEHLTIKINRDGIIRVDGNYKDGKASRSFFNEYIIPDGVDYEALEFRIYNVDQNTLVIVGGIGSHGGETAVAQSQQQPAAKTDSSTAIKRTENVRISSTFTETIESTELEGSEDMSKEIRTVDNQFEAKVNVSEYKTEEIHVKISKKVVLIYTSRKEVTKTDTRREIKKSFQIPSGVKPESITSVVGKDGNLTVSAPVDDELARQQHQVQETTKTSITTTSTTTTQQLQQQQQQQKKQEHETNSKQVVQQQQLVQQTSTDEVLIRSRTVNTTKNVTGEDLKDVKINRDRFEMNVDLREYNLEDVTVKIIKTRRVITISANHKSEFESRSTYREFTLPDGTPHTNPDVIDAVLHSNGILTITGPCTPQTLPAAITDITDEITKAVVKQQQENTSVQQQQKNTSVQQQQQKNTSVQQQQQNTSVQRQQQNTSVQERQDTSVQQHQTQQQTVQSSRYTKITRETFSSSTMTSLDITGSDSEVDEPLILEPDTPVDDVTDDMVEDEDGNLIVELNVKGYRAEDIMVKASKSTVTIVLSKNDEANHQICKTIHVPPGVVVTPDTIRSILDKSKGTLIIMVITKKSVTTTVTKQISDNTTDEQNNEQKRIDSLQQQKQQVQQRQETVQENQTTIQTQQRINQQKQVQQKQESVEETQTETQQQINQQKQVQQKQETVQDTQTKIQTQQQINQQKLVQQKQESVEETQIQTKTQQQINQQKQVQQKQKSVEEIQTQIENLQQINQQKQLQQKQESVQTRQQDQRQQNNSTTTSKRTIKTTTTTVESLQKLGYNFESATKQVYTGDTKFFERATPVIDYKPEELDVKIAMPWIVIEGKQEMSAENGWRSKQFTKMFTVPEGVKLENILLEWNDAGDVVNCTAQIG